MPSTVTDGAIHVVAAAIRNTDGAVLVAQRPLHKHQGGLWEFPGGKLEPGESPLEGLAREIREEIGVVVSEARPLIRIRHDYGDRRVLLDVWSVTAWHGEPHGHEGQPLQWVDAGRLASLSMPAADAPVVTALQLPDRYLVTPEPVNADDWLVRLADRIDRGETLVQLRAKSLSMPEYEALARRAMTIVHARRSARVLLNASPETAMQLGADGVHLTAERLLACRRRPLPDDRLVAASCHDRAQIEWARSIGCDFAVLGPVMRTASHPGVEPMGWRHFHEIVDGAGIPVYAIGGLTPRERETAWNSGAQGIAAITGLWNDQ